SLRASLLEAPEDWEPAAAGIRPRGGRHLMFRSRTLSVAVGIVLVAACAVGPNYKRPKFDAAASYKEQNDWKPSEPSDTLSRGPWWRIFNDETLDELE